MTASPETYHHIIEYGLRKTSLRFDRLLLQAFMAGVYIGMAGHGCMCLAGGIPTDPSDTRSISKSMQKFVYASVFPTAFIAIIFTGAELFTGNTMTMLICLIERRITFLHLVINWLGSLLGNWLGTLFAAYFLSYLPGGYDTEPLNSYLCHMAEVKVSYGWGACFLRGIGCNVLVCLAVWNVTACDDASGKILALWFPIVTFCIAGYEHIIANMYTLQLALMSGCSSIPEVITGNLIPTFLGNVVGGCVLIGAVYWYNFYPVEEVGHECAAAFNALNEDRDLSISRVHSRATVSPSILGFGDKPQVAFGGQRAPAGAAQGPVGGSCVGGWGNDRTHSECASNAGSVHCAAGTLAGAPLPQQFPKPKSDLETDAP